MVNRQGRRGRGRYNAQNINLPRRSSPEGVKRRLYSRIEGFEKLKGVPGEFTKPGSRNSRK